jgi:hypothetical protein
MTVLYFFCVTDRKRFIAFSMHVSCNKITLVCTSACLIWVPCEILSWVGAYVSSSKSMFVYEDTIPINTDDDIDYGAKCRLYFWVVYFLKTMCGVVGSEHTVKRMGSLWLRRGHSVNLICDLLLNMQNMSGTDVSSLIMQ